MWPKRPLPANNSTFCFPSNWSLLALQGSKGAGSVPVFYLYNNSYYFTFKAPSGTSYWRPSLGTNTIFISQRFYDPLYPGYRNALLSTFRTLTSVMFSKMKFKGKGYYVYKTARNTIAPQFGYAHRVYVYAFNVSVKFLSKTSVLIFGLSKRDLVTVGRDFRSKRPINIFTGRGVRFARQVVYKKVGKVSSYR